MATPSEIASNHFGGQIPFFLQNVLTRPAAQLPRGAQWVLSFEGSPADYRGVLPVDAIKKGVEFEPAGWNIDKAIEATLHTDFQQTKGCVFAQAIQIPGESTTVNPEGIQKNGFIRTTVGDGRDAYSAMQIMFLETNISFVDNVIRPWVIATSHLGMVARKGKDNYRCNFSVYKLGTTSHTEPPFVLQQYTFWGACPVSITGEEYNYTQTTAALIRDTTFIYHYYTLNSGNNNAALSNQIIN